MLTSGLLGFVIILALIFGLTNGMRDSSSIVATMISSRAFRPQVALGITAVVEFIGPFLFGVTVAKTVGSDIVASSALSLQALTVGLVGAILWNLITWFLGVPSSSSHALIGGLIGATLISSGTDAIKVTGLYKVLLGLLLSPLLSFAVGFLALKVIFLLSAHASPAINTFFKYSQLVTAVVLAFSHGTNDTQKTIGIIVLSLLIGGSLSTFSVPLWVIFVGAGAMSLGTTLGGWKMIRTLGGKFYKIRPVDSFTSQLTSGLVILSASAIGLPVSTSQVVSSSIIGVGASERFGKVRWGVAGDILTAWVITIPISALFSAGIYYLLVLLHIPLS